MKNVFTTYLTVLAGAAALVSAQGCGGGPPVDHDHHHHHPSSVSSGFSTSTVAASTAEAASSSIASSSTASSPVASSAVAVVSSAAVSSSVLPESSAVAVASSSSASSSSSAIASSSSSSLAASSSTVSSNAAAVSKATTTRYYDGQEGACGCGTSSGPFSWQLGVTTDVYTAAGSQALFDASDSTWCGAGCGKCYNLTSTGEAPCSTCGTGGEAGQSIIVMVTNLCPNNGNAEWCPAVGGTNDYGYGFHFDIMAQAEVFGDNPVVEFEEVDCPGTATGDYAQCVCA